MRNTPLKKVIPTRASSRLQKNLVDETDTDAIESTRSPKKEEKPPVLEVDSDDNETSIPKEKEEEEEEHEEAETIELKSTSSEEEEQDEEEAESDMTDGEEPKSEIGNIVESDEEEVEGDDDGAEIEEEDDEMEEEDDKMEEEDDEMKDEEDDEEEEEDDEEEEEEDEIEKQEQNQDSGSDSDEAPEGISLKESKKKAQQKEQDIVEANKLLKLQKKQLVQDRQLKNRKQQERANKDKKKDTNKAKSKDDIDNEKTNDDYIDTILSQVNKEKTVTKTQPKNMKITFDEEFDFGDDDIDEGIEADSNAIQAKHLYSVNKIKDIGADARDFLQEHFYGRRLRREGKKKSKYSKKNLKLISKRPIGKQSKPY